MTDEGLICMEYTHRHRIGCVCAPPCEQCGESAGNIGSMRAHDVEVYPQPMRIVREATEAEYRAFLALNGYTFRHPGKFYYWVSTD